MEIREILVLLRPEGPNDAMLAAATGIAAETRGFVHGLCIYAVPAPTTAECFALGEVAVDAVVDHIQVETEELVAPLHRIFQERLATAGVDGDWTALDTFSANAAIVARARLVDLVVMPRPEQHETECRHVADTLLADSGTPCLFVPADFKYDGIRRIVIAWNGTREATRAIDEAMPLLQKAEAVEVVVVGDVEHMPTPAGIEALERHLARHGIVIGTTQATNSRDTAEIILDCCQIFRADLLVMGAYGHARMAETILGGVSRSILLHAPLPVLMVH
ncbi:universal stress protein [Sphingomonas sp. MMS24-J13]|uniref:universal stress protein n=1 Tax=Sphingomonas sp. MMS24-J13 TaxID=3238686 RepID=UPI003850FA20